MNGLWHFWVLKGSGQTAVNSTSHTEFIAIRFFIFFQLSVFSFIHVCGVITSEYSFAMRRMSFLAGTKERMIFLFLWTIQTISREWIFSAPFSL